MTALYERAVKVYAVLPNVWYAYLQFAERHMAKEQVLAVYARATRNCPASGTIWAAYIRAMERAGRPPADIDALAGKAMESVDNAPSLVEVLHSHIDAVRRRLAPPTSAPPETLRSCCSSAVDSLAARFPKKGNEASSILQHWGRFEARVFRDIAKARDLWERALKNNAADAQAWLEYAAIERQFGLSEKVRSIFKRALNAVTQGAEPVVQAWVQFEREEGTLDQWQQACERGTQRLEVLGRKQQQEVQQQQAQKQPPAKKKPRIEEQQEHTPTDSPDSEQQRRLLERTMRTVHVSNVPFQLGEEALRDLFAAFGSIVAVRIGHDKFGKARGFCFVEFEEESAAKAALAMDKKELEGRKISVVPSSATPSQRAPAPLPATADDARTIFVSNLPFKATADDLRNLFSRCGELADVRLIHDETKKSKGFGYVQFVTEESVGAGLALDKFILLGRPIKVQPCKPTLGKRGRTPAVVSAIATPVPTAADDAPPSKEPVTFARPRSLRGKP
jgi:RNA recognition motif-containing protein